jgi:TonB family protein
MFASLPASGPRPGPRFSGGMLAAGAHGAVIAVAVWATAVRAAPPRFFPTGDLVLIPESDGHSAPLGPAPAPQIPSCVDCAWGIIPVVLPPGAFDSLLARNPATTSIVAGAAGDTPQSGDGMLPVDLVDQRPEVLAGPPLAYPELLRQAGIQGRVVVRAVVDTLGRVEVGSAAVVASANPGFDAPALAYVRRALFRPARVLGRAVRVLVEVPIEFHIAR